MPQSVRAWARHIDARFEQIVPGPARDSRRADGPDWGAGTEKHVAVVGFGSAVFQVGNEGLSDGGGEREGSRVTSLALWDGQPLPLPVDVIEGQSRDLPAPQPIDH